MRRAGLGVVLTLIVAMAQACGGGGSDLTAPEGGSAVASRDVLDGIPQTTSSIVVRFDRPVELVSNDVPLASYFELEVPYATADELETTRVLVKSAEFAETSKREVTLTVDRLVPAGTKVFVDKKGFEKDATGRLELRADSDLDVFGVLYASTALTVADPTVVTADTAPEATAEDRDPAAQRQALERHLNARGTDEESIARALERYDTMSTEIVTSPKARAALAALTGTFAEPAIDSLLTAGNCTGLPASVIAFQVPPGSQELFARVTYAPDGARVVSLNPSIEGESLELLMPIFLHEAIHCDQVGGRFEEIAATAIDSFFWMNLLAAFPELARGGTPLTYEFNIDAIALMNSGRKVPESVGVLPSPGIDSVLPGTNVTHSSFAELIAAAYPTIDYNPSPAEPLAQAYIAQLAAAVGMEEDSAFNLEYLDELLGRAASPELMQLVTIALGLAPAN